MRFLITLAVVSVVAWVLAMPALAMNFIEQLDQAQLQQKIERLFPVAHADALYQVELTHPQVLLREGSDSIGLRLDVTGNVMQQLPLTGRSLMEGHLRFEPKSGAFYLEDAELMLLYFDCLPAQYTSEFRGLAQQS